LRCTFLRLELGKRSAELRGELVAGARQLDLQLGGFPRAEQQVGDDFGRPRGNGPPDLFVLVGVFLSHNFLVDVLEDLVEAELAESLRGVADEGGGPAEGELSVGLDLGDAVAHALAEGGVELLLALHDVEGHDGSVGQPAGQGTADHALEVVARIMHVSSHCHLLINITNRIWPKLNLIHDASPNHHHLTSTPK
jgi:hypothetical protein